MLLHAEQLAAAAAEHLCPAVVVVCVVFSVTVFFNLAIFSLNFLVARGRAAGGTRLLLRPTARAGAAPAVSASKSLPAPFIGLCLVMGAGLHAKSLAAAAAEYQIDPAVVALFHLTILSIHKTLASHRAEDEPKQLLRSRRLPLLPFVVVLALAISAASSVQTVMADGAPDLPQDASVWAALVLAMSFNIAH
ncbi:unnamed protein product [Miscanthus lutarioriparius]|uniref:Uncharacterized protein n=1 Tax=Miscanthus lutarioriparius TaxID=422564 RepID=A0A811NPG0_9POAL|nr:unnamed protein product [Miscanthus lutarioriparius]